MQNYFVYMTSGGAFLVMIYKREITLEIENVIYNDNTVQSISSYRSLLLTDCVSVLLSLHQKYPKPFETALTNTNSLSTNEIQPEPPMKHTKCSRLYATLHLNYDVWSV